MGPLRNVQSANRPANRPTNLSFAIAALALVTCGCSTHQDSDLPDSRLGDAIVLLLKNELDEALTHCDAAIAANPMDPTATLLRGEICEAMGDFNAARLAYQRAGQLSPKNKVEATHRLKHLNQLEQRLSGTNEPLQAYEQHAATPVAYKTTQQVKLTSTRELHRPDEEEAAYIDEAYIEKDYRRASHPSSNGRYKESRRPTDKAAPSNTYRDRLSRTLAEGQWRDVMDRESARLASLGGRFEPLDSAPDNGLPAQIVRFDMGLGLNPGFQVPRVSTTGRRSTFVEEEVEQPRVGLLVGQSIQPQGVKVNFDRFVDFPRSPTAAPTPDPLAPQRTCSDGIDNNSDGTTDAGDRNCWADRQNPSTFNPNLTEAGPVILPTARFQTPLVSPVPSAPAAAIQSAPASAPPPAAPAGAPAGGC